MAHTRIHVKHETLREEIKHHDEDNYAKPQENTREYEVLLAETEHLRGMDSAGHQEISYSSQVYSMHHTRLQNA
jgi:hypothetical protein